MSSDQRYQSHLLNAILRQSREVMDQWQRNVRQAKVASFWGLQMAVYPVYLLFQVTRLSEQVLRQADTQGQRVLKAALDPDQSPLQGAQADIPVRRVLEAIQISATAAETEDAEFVVEIATPPSQRPNVFRRYQRWIKRLSQRRSVMVNGQQNDLLRGLASDLESRHLILVTPDNELLDVLTLAQQKQLLQLMTWEGAHYQRQQRLNHQLRDVTQLRQRPLSLPATRSQMLSPVRGFRKVMGWFQASPLATATNLFQEAKVIDPLQLLMGAQEEIPLPDDLGGTLKRLSPQITPEGWELMDVAIATLENRSQRLLRPVTDRLPESLLRQFTRRSHSSSPSHPAVISEPAPPRQALDWLQGAFSALLGRQPLPLAPINSREVAAPDSQVFPQRQAAGSWLSWKELFGSKTLSPLSTTPSQEAFPSTVAGPSVTDTLVATTPDLAGRVTVDDQGIEIQVDAVFVEYEQHPLERILNALDHIVSWLEKRLIPWFEQSWSVIKVYFQKLGQP